MKGTKMTESKHAAHSLEPAQSGTTIRKQGAWGLWWLVLITAGIYYFIWYARINRELASLLHRPVPTDGQWWSQLIPIYGLLGLAATAKRVNAAHAATGSPARISVVLTWLVAPIWFGSHTRYVQRRINLLADASAGPAAPIH
jgi:hypothetical protein